MKGKCFSGINRGQRKKSDFYQTPYSITEQLLEKEDFECNGKTILEPACGKGAITKILLEKKRFFLTIKYDIQDGKEYNFLNENMEVDYIITNPPFSLAFEFIQKAKKVVKEKFAMLLPLSYLHGQKRYENKIFIDPEYPLKKIYVFTRYPLLTDTIRKDGKYSTGMIAYAWYVWEKAVEKELLVSPIIKWIDNNKYVLKKGVKK